jgi:formamidopyrimidine-DNA glycosylase
MPELPEMQALAERLDAALQGSALVRVTPLQFSSLKTVVPAYDSLISKKVAKVWRRGKYNIIDLDGGRLMFHLSQGGRVDLESPPKATRPKLGVVRFVWDNSTSLFIKEFGTERKAAWWVLEPGDLGPAAGLGPEPFEDGFVELIQTTEDGRRTHGFLRDQRTVAGIGRGFADDILNAAKISPFATMGSLSKDDRARLIEATREMLGLGLESERKRKGGLPTKLGERFLVHKKLGDPCPNCGAALHHVSYASHEICYCPACQTGGRVLADRRLSRILR